MNEQETKPAPLIYSRIADCIADIKAVGKDHRNQQQGYQFRAIDDFFNAMQPVLATHKVFITPTILEYKREERTTKSGGILMTTLAHVRFKVCTEDGSFIEADAIGEGSDSGDKSANKCASQALKYLFMQVFCVRVNGENLDTENDSPAYTPKAPQNAPKQYPVRQAPTQPKSAPQANVERAAATPASVLPAQATEKTREWAIRELCALVDHNAAFDYLSGKGFIAFDGDKGGWNGWRLEHVPTSKQALAALADEIRKTIQVPEGESQQIVDSGDLLPEEIGSAVITVPRKGMRRNDYLQAPDTIQSLYSAMKSGDAEAQRRLWGLCRGWSPEPWVDGQGKKHPIKPEDAECRVALDLFVEHYEKTHGKGE